MKRLGGAVAALALSVAGLTACGSDDGSDNGGTAQPAATPSAAASSPAATGKLAAADVGDYGKILVDGNGRTVYVFDKDTAGTSNCSGDCLAKWPVVAAGEGQPQLDGVDAALVSTVTRTDGTKQLAVKGMPLYLFASDTQPGEAKGQAVGGVWWVVGADGQKITTKPGASGDGYGY